MIIPAQKKNLFGFTLIELLIVIAILGILAAAVLVAVNPTKRTNQAKDANVKSDIASIAGAVQAYYTEKGYYPVDLAAVKTNGDLKEVPLPPTGVYTYTAAPVNCDNLAPASQCTSALVSYALFYPAVAGNLWCFESTTGKADELAPAACTAP